MFRNRASKLFDDVIGDSLYPRLRIRAKQQTHEKLRVLKDVVPEAEEGITRQLTALTDLYSVESFDRTYLDAIHKGNSELVIWPFLPKTKIFKNYRLKAGRIVCD